MVNSKDIHEMVKQLGVYKGYDTSDGKSGQNRWIMFATADGQQDIDDEVPF